MPQTKPMSWISMITLLVTILVTSKTLNQATSFTPTTPHQKSSPNKKMKW